jgi:hypothetical protein
VLLNAYTRLFSRWAKHATYGVNAILPQIPLQPGDAAIPTPIAIYDDVDSPAALADFRPPDKRALVLCVDGDLASSQDRGRGEQAQERIVMGAFYMARDIGLEIARHEAEYVLEALACNHRLLADRAWIEHLGAPAGSTDASFRSFGRAHVVEPVDQMVSMRVTPSPGTDSYAGVLISPWRGTSVPFKLTGV